MSSATMSQFAIGFAVQSSNGNAPESKQIEEKYTKYIKELKETESVGRYSYVEQILNELYEVFLDCRQDNWDGYGANAISIDTYIKARDIIPMLNSAFLDVPMPEITPEPDGNIAFEWFDEYGRTFVFSIDDNQTLTYAGIFGQSKTHGYERLTDFLPGTLIYNLKRLFPK